MSKEEYEAEIRKIYHEAGDGVIKLQDKLGWYNDDKMSIYKEKWEDIKKVLSEVPSSDTLIGYLESIELDINEFKAQYGEEKINNALFFAKDLKDRYSVLWLYLALCNKKR